MKRVLGILVAACILLSFGMANADPRMEINDNFAHMILDPNNTDDEIFVGGAAPQIWTDGAGQANGVYEGAKLMSKEAVEALLQDHPGGAAYTSDDSAAQCTMVESNGTAYASDDWISIVKVRQPYRALNMVYYKLICRDGAQQ